MRNTKAQKSSSILAKLLWIPIIIVIGGGIAAFLYYLYIPKYRELREVRRQAQAIEQQLKALQTQNEALLKQIEELESDTFRAEDIARTEHGFQKPDETVYIIE